MALVYFDFLFYIFRISVTIIAAVRWKKVAHLRDMAVLLDDLKRERNDH